MRPDRWVLWVFAVGWMSVVVGCRSATSPTDESPLANFESDDPSIQNDSDNSGSYDAGAPEPGSGDGDEAASEIAEADIVQIQGNRLYALSRRVGLSVIDIGKRDQLSLLGRYPMRTATPFEMYLRGDVAIVILNGWPVGYGSYRSRVVTIDVGDASELRAITQYELPGTISDSRIVGDVLYLVTHQDDDCGGCQSKPTVFITSLDVGDPTSIRRIDELSFVSAEHYEYKGGEHAVTATSQRIYVASPEWGTAEKYGSRIQVVDISDPEGALRLGANVRASGIVSNRWQMDEYDGVLRVISQSPERTARPKVETFRIASSDELQPLASVDLQLPRPEELKSVRFDGTRGYAITFERTDPLFTIDLSDPENPAQKGKLVIPGWVHHMEPRGDRLYGLGFDPGHHEGSLHVSIFDVSDLSNPTMLDRVNFGGDWSFLGEDQNRIHKAFQILPDAGLILVPYSGFLSSKGCASVTSGVQLIDLVGDDLTKRGLTPSQASPRRAVLHQGRLIAVGDERIEVFDIDDRDAPTRTDSVKLAHSVVRLLPVGEHLVRVVRGGATGKLSLEIVPKDAPDALDPLGSLDFEADLFDHETKACVHPSDHHQVRLFANGRYVYVLVTIADAYSSTERTALSIVDIGNPSAPRVVTKKTFPFTLPPPSQTGEPKNSSRVEAGDSIVPIGSTLVFTRYGELQVLDLADPSAPRHTALTLLPESVDRSAIQAYGNLVMLGRWERIADKPSKVRFYVDRVDVADPTDPKLLPPINVPGSLLSFEPETGRFLTIDYRRDALAKPNGYECSRDHGPNVEFDHETSSCTVVHRSLELLELRGDHVVRIDHRELPDELWISNVARGDDRVFLARGQCFGCGQAGLTVVGDTRSGSIALRDDNAIETGIATITARDKRAVFITYGDMLTLVDARKMPHPVWNALQQLSGPAYDIAFADDRVYVALGRDGVHTSEIAR